MYAFLKKYDILHLCQSASNRNQHTDLFNQKTHDLACLVILSAYGSIYRNVKDYETKNKMLVDIEYKQWQMRTGLVTHTIHCDVQDTSSSVHIQ